MRHDEDDAQAHQQAAQDGEQEQHACAAALIGHGVLRADALRLLRVQQTVAQQFRQGFGEAGVAHRSGKGTEREEEWRKPQYSTALLLDLQEQEVTPTSGRRVAFGRPGAGLRGNRDRWTPCEGLAFFHYDDVFVLPKHLNSKTVVNYPQLTVKGQLANYASEWFKTTAEARLHIVDLAEYIFGEEQRIAAA